jgi:hypothetical protein
MKEKNYMIISVDKKALIKFKIPCVKNDEQISYRTLVNVKKRPFKISHQLTSY